MSLLTRVFLAAVEALAVPGPPTDAQWRAALELLLGYFVVDDLAPDTIAKIIAARDPTEGESEAMAKASMADIKDRLEAIEEGRKWLLRAMFSAVLRSCVLLAKPDSITVPFSVSTLIDEPATLLSSNRRDFTRLVIPASSM